MAYNIYTNTFDFQPQPKRRAEQLQKEKTEAKDHLQDDMLSANSNQAANNVKPATN